MINTLDVILWNRKVGTLVASKNGYESQICFYFDQAFANSGLDVAPLRAPITGVHARGGVPVYPDKEKLFGGLPSFIADSLPDNWGHLVFNEWAKAHNIKQKDLTVLDRLAYIGRRGMGAFEFVPPTDEALETPFRIEISLLSELAQKALDKAKGFHAVFSPTLEIESLFKIGTSAGGRRPKAVINLNPDTMECFSGQVAPPQAGFIPMIIKFDEHGEIPTTRIEYSYWLMADAAGLNMMPSRLLEFENETHFVTERFDRRGSEKVHVQTLAAMAPEASSYEDLFDTAQRLGVDQQAMQMLFRQMALNVLGANIDDHNKNFSFIMDKTGYWTISPAYDFTFTVDPSAPFYVNRHSLTVNRKNHEINRMDMMIVAEKFNIKGADSIISAVADIVRNYRSFALKARVPDHWIQKIENEISDRLEGLG